MIVLIDKYLDIWTDKVLIDVLQYRLVKRNRCDKFSVHEFND